MASQQRAVSSVREFAAAHAYHEEKQRSNRQVTEFLQLEKLEEAQRRMAEHARYIAGSCYSFHSMHRSSSIHPLCLYSCMIHYCLAPCTCRDKVVAAIKQGKIKEELPDMKLDDSAVEESNSSEENSGLSDLNAEVS